MNGEKDVQFLREISEPTLLKQLKSTVRADYNSLKNPFPKAMTEEVQKALKRQGETVAVDGVYGRETIEALKRFWEKNPKGNTGRQNRQLSASEPPKGLSEKAEKLWAQIEDIEIQKKTMEAHQKAEEIRKKWGIGGGQAPGKQGEPKTKPSLPEKAQPIPRYIPGTGELKKLPLYPSDQSPEWIRYSTGKA